LQHAGGGTRGICAPEVTARERRVVDGTRRRRRDPIRAYSSRRPEDPHLSDTRVESPEDPALPAEPQDATPVEDSRIQVGIAGRSGQREAANAPRLRVHPDDRVEPAGG